MRLKTALLYLLTLAPLLFTGALAVTAAEPRTSAPVIPNPTAFLSTLSAAQPSPCSTSGAAAESAIFASTAKAGVRSPACGACSSNAWCVGAARGASCYRGTSGGWGYCEINVKLGEECADGLWLCYCA